MSDVVTNSANLETVLETDPDKIESLAELRAIVKSLQGKLDELRLHCVYGFWTKSGELFYVGQTTDFEVRIYDHMQHQGKKDTKFYIMLDKELEEGIYVNVIFDKLTELEANDKENCLIKMVKRDSEAAANINDGRCTKRFAALSVEGREREIQSASAAASGVFNSLDKELLINDKNWKDRFTSGRGLKTGKCSKCGREIGLRGDKCGGCGKAARKSTKRAAEGPAQDSITSRVNANYSNQVERVLCCVMYQQQPTLSQRDVAKKICAITGDNSAKQTTVGTWHAKFSKTDFNLANFVLMRSGNKIGFTDLSEKTIQALVVYMHGRNFNKIQTVTQLNRCFASIHSFKLVEVQDIRANIDEIKQRLKGGVIEEDPPTKKPKN